jgi:hypothetical protein
MKGAPRAQVSELPKPSLVDAVVSSPLATRELLRAAPLQQQGVRNKALTPGGVRALDAFKREAPPRSARPSSPSLFF